MISALKLMAWISARCLSSVPTASLDEPTVYARDLGYRAGWNDAQDAIRRQIINLQAEERDARDKVVVEVAEPPPRTYAIRVRYYTRGPHGSRDARREDMIRGLTRDAAEIIHDALVSGGVDAEVMA